MRFAPIVALLLCALPLTAQRPAAPAADLIVTNARIYTVDDTRPVVRAMAVRGGRVQFTGSEREALALRGPSTRVLDLHGQVVIPGMVDAHAHLSGLGEFLASVNLFGATSWDEVVSRIAARAKTAKPGEWIIGRGWDQNLWRDTRFPTHEALSAAVPGNPVYLTRVDGHAAIVNDAGMKLAHVSAASVDPSGGRILRGAGGAPTGVFIDNAKEVVQAAIPANTADDERRILRAAIREAHRWGLVGIHDAGESRAAIDVAEAIARTGELPFRLYMMIGDDSLALIHYLARGPQVGLYDNRLWIRAIKLYADGAMGSRGAALLEPYSDDPSNSGLLLSAPGHIQRIAERALIAGFQVATHAIGDRGNRVVLDAYEAALRAVPVADHRFRIEHAQTVHHDDLARFAQLGVIPSMQSVHQTSDMYWIGKRLGAERLPGAYAWRSLLETGVVIPNGSDFPVEAVNPLLSFHSAVSRQDAANYPVGGWHAEQRMTRDEALKSMTLWPAYAAFQESIMGSLTPGKLADFVVLDRDIMTVPESEILGTAVVSTWVGGVAVYERGR